MRTFAEMEAAVEAHNEAQDKNFLAKIVEDATAEFQSELDQEIDECGPCVQCGQTVHEVGSPICDHCDPERQVDPAHVCDDTIPFNTGKCETAGCNNTVDEEGDLCHGCEADLRHRNFWGSGIPMGHHEPS